MGKWKHRLYNRDVINRKAICSFCGAVDIVNHRGVWKCKKGKFCSSKGYPDHYRSQPAKEVCAICNNKKPLVWDHSHTKGSFRGYICKTCNTMLGMAYDNPSVLRAGADYLERCI